MDRLGHMEISYFWIGQETYDITNQGQVPIFPPSHVGREKPGLKECKAWVRSERRCQVRGPANGLVRVVVLVNVLKIGLNSRAY